MYALPTRSVYVLVCYTLHTSTTRTEHYENVTQLTTVGSRATFPVKVCNPHYLKHP